MPPHDDPDLTADHLVPVANGGAAAGPYQVLCRTCNGRKGDRASAAPGGRGAGC